MPFLNPLDTNGQPIMKDKVSAEAIYSLIHIKKAILT